MKKVKDLPEGFYTRIVLLNKGESNYANAKDVQGAEVIKKSQQKYLLESSGKGKRSISFGEGTTVLGFHNSLCL